MLCFGYILKRKPMRKAIPSSMGLHLKIRQAEFNSAVINLEMLQAKGFLNILLNSEMDN